MNEFEIVLHSGQAAIYNSIARFKVVAAGRRFGKSHYAAYTLAEEAMKSVNEFGYPLTIEHGVYYVAPTFDQAKRVMWPKLKQLLGYKSEGGLIANENVNDGWIQLISGRRIYIRGADNPDSLRGIGLSYVVLDEYADMKPEVWELIIRPALFDVKGGALFIGTPKGKNHFYKLFMSAMGWPGIQAPDDYKPEAWKDWEAFHFKSVDNPFLDYEELENSALGGSMSAEAVRQELDASFISGGGKVLKRDWFPIIPHIPSANVYNEHGNVVVQGNANRQQFITVDLAGFKKAGSKVLRSDETVIAVTTVSPEATSWYIEDIQHGHWDARETALRIVRTCSQHSTARLGIEAGALMHAIGPYLEDYMREFNRYTAVEPLKHGGVRKIDRIATALQGRAQRRKIALVKGDWNEAFLTQADDFPDPLAHDDILDAVAYVDQMASINYVHAHDLQEWEALDMDAGY